MYLFVRLRSWKQWLWSLVISETRSTFFDITQKKWYVESSVHTSSLNMTEH